MAEAMSYLESRDLDRRVAEAMGYTAREDEHGYWRIYSPIGANVSACGLDLERVWLHGAPGFSEDDARLTLMMRWAANRKMLPEIGYREGADDWSVRLLARREINGAVYGEGATPQQAMSRAIAALAAEPVQRE